MDLTPTQIERALRLSVREGAAWALMVGLGETYFIADAVRLGASTLELALTVTLPLALSGAGPVLALSSLRTRDRRSVTVAAAVAQAAVLATLALLDGTGRSAPRTLIALVCLYQITGLAAGTAWSSWYGDLVPETRRGRYFARRNRTVYVATCLGLIAGGLLLQFVEPRAVAIAGEGGRGYALIFSLAVACRLGSAALLGRSPEPAFQGIAGPSHTKDYFRSSPGRRARRLLAVAAAFHFAAYLSSPYFAPFMLETLHFTYFEYMVATVWVVVVKALSTIWWGREVDRLGAGRVLRVGLFLVAMVPLPWIAARGLGIVLVGQALSGFSWCAYELGFFTAMLGATTPATRPAIFAAQSLLVGWVQLGAAVVAAWFVTTADTSFRTLFAVSAAARFGIAALVPLWVRREMVLAPVRSASLALRSLGFRPSGGLSRRPVFDASGSDDEIVREEAPGR
jgi:predicted MFS family arabinose efflux permease